MSARLRVYDYNDGEPVLGVWDGSSEFCFYAPTFVTVLLIAEHALRERAQIEEKLQRRAAALQKAIYVNFDNDDRLHLNMLNKLSSNMEKEFTDHEYILHGAESFLPKIIERSYAALKTAHVEAAAVKRDLGLKELVKVIVLPSAGAALVSEAMNLQTAGREI
ncbi:hypothetical protein N7454_009606 [Penicillium verhagenii]|nr:hypothetical protein N7454_009606 [Penicillium verhagenii]